MIPTPSLRSSEPKSNPYLENNPYTARKLWPPDFSKLSPKQQFRLERRYKRRAKLKFQNPAWIKGTKLVQFFAMTGMAVAGIFFIDWKQPNQPFQPVRKWFNEVTGTEWAPTTEIVQRRRVEEYLKNNNSPVREGVQE